MQKYWFKVDLSCHRLRLSCSHISFAFSRLSHVRSGEFEEMHTITPKGYRYVKYAFKLPADTKRCKVETKLNCMI
jgi:hypothetical protein